MLQTYSIGSRTYHIYIPTNPPQQFLPTIVAFHGGGGHWEAMAQHWGIDPQNPVPPPVLENYLLVFPEADPHLSHKWIHHKGDDAFPDYDLRFVDALLNDLTTIAYPTGGMGIQNVSADPNLLYTAGFSNGGGMVWQIAYSDRVGRFQGFAVVARGLDREKVEAYQQHFGAQPPAIPLIYVHGTADAIFGADVLRCPTPEFTLSAESVFEMLRRNGIPAGAPATTQLIPGSANITEVVMQLFTGGAEAFSYVAILNGGHHWPEPNIPPSPTVASHFNTTRAIVEFWKSHAGLP